MSTKKNIITIVILLGAIIIGLFIYNFDNLKINNTKEPVVENKIPNLLVGPIVGVMQSPAFGNYLTDTKGRTLYVYGNDKKLESVCATDECIKMWPPFIYDFKEVSSFDDILSRRMNVIPESKKIWPRYSYGEQPLYYYSGDKNPGDINGNGMENGKWSIVQVVK
ncbi:MAG: hypothetical protein ABL876_15470 [Chitinophagaceae bacterium]